MKTLLKTVALLSASVAINANAVISVSDTNETQFEIGGTIQPECKVNNTTSAGASTLNLASSDAQQVASVEIWCNTGDASASTTYSSLNGGVLTNENGQDIEYRVDISDTQSDVNLSTDQTFQQSSGSGVSGASAARTVSISPVITGFEFAGTYSDTIAVTVTYN